MEEGIVVDYDSLINSLDFVEVVVDKFEEQGVKKGDVVFIAGLKAFPTDEDPYTQRIKFFVHLMEGDYIDVDKGIYVMDPASVLKLPQEKQEYYIGLAKERAEATVQ